MCVSNFALSPSNEKARNILALIIFCQYHFNLKMLIILKNYSNFESNIGSDMDMFKLYTKVGDIT